MRQVVIHTAGDVRVEEREDPRIVEPTDAIIRLTATCICGSDLWPYRGVEPADHQVMGHEYVGTQSERARIPYADGTLVPTPGQPDPELIPSLLAASDVLGTGWFGAVAAEAGPGKTVAVVGDGAVGLMGVLAARQLGAERIIAMSRHPERQELARFYGATDIVTERGDEGVAKIKELTNGLGAHSVIEAVGTQESTMQAIGATRPGGHMGFVGVNYDVAIPGIDLFFAGIHVHGGPAPVRRFLPGLIRLICDRKIDPGKVFDLTLPLEEAAEGYTAMDERRAIKVLLTV
ncbi:zinc-binding dehydrogenase [Nonomuraea sp. NPDC003201]